MVFDEETCLYEPLLVLSTMRLEDDIQPANKYNYVI